MLGSVGSRGHEHLTAIGDVVNVASRIEAANKDAGTRFMISEALYGIVEDQVEMLDFVRTRLRGTSERMTLYEIGGLKPEVEAALNAKVSRDTERYGGREWMRAFPADELAVGERRILDLDRCDIVVYRAENGYVAFNNACPHMRLPLFDRTGLSKEGGKMPQADSTVTEDLGIVCRWHNSCYDLQTGEIRDWCPLLNEDGAAPGMEHAGDISKNQSPLDVFQCRVSDGQLWISLD